MLKVFPREKGQSSKDYVVRVLTENIVAINLEPGQKIIESELCSALSLSRTPCREAEIELAQRKLITVFPKRGTFVSLIDTELVEEVRRLRCVLESELAAIACKKLGKEQLDKLWENVTLWEMYIKRGDQPKIFEFDKQFHKMLYEFCGCSYWYELVSGVAPHFDRTTVLSYMCGFTHNVVNDHIGLLKAIEAGNEDAAKGVVSLHMERYTQNIPTIKERFGAYFKT